MLDIGSEGTILHRIHTRPTGYPKTCEDLPHSHDLPPTYEQAVSGRDHSVKVEDLATCTPAIEPRAEAKSFTVDSRDYLFGESETLSVTCHGATEMEKQTKIQRNPVEFESLPPPPPSSSTDLHEDDEEEVDDDQPLLSS